MITPVFFKTIILSLIIVCFQSSPSSKTIRPLNYNIITTPFISNTSIEIAKYLQLLEFAEIEENTLIENNLIDFLAEVSLPYTTVNRYQNLILDLTQYYIVLNALYTKSGNELKANFYLDKLHSLNNLYPVNFTFSSTVLNLYNVYILTSENKYLTEAIQYQLKAISESEKKVDDLFYIVNRADKVTYRELLKGMGILYFAAKEYTLAESYYFSAIAYELKNQIDIGKLQKFESNILWPIQLPSTEDRLVSFPIMPSFSNNNLYKYHMDPYLDLFLLNLEVNKEDEAYLWLEKSYQKALTENGNALTSQEVETTLKKFSFVNKQRIEKIKSKYFPTK